MKTVIKLELLFAVWVSLRASFCLVPRAPFVSILFILSQNFNIEIVHIRVDEPV